MVEELKSEYNETDPGVRLDKAIANSVVAQRHLIAGIVGDVPGYYITDITNICREAKVATSDLTSYKGSVVVELKRVFVNGQRLRIYRVIPTQRIQEFIDLFMAEDIPQKSVFGRPKLNNTPVDIVEAIGQNLYDNIIAPSIARLKEHAFDEICAETDGKDEEATAASDAFLGELIATAESIYLLNTLTDKEGILKECAKGVAS